MDKSHLIAIGEQLYSRSIELIRELIGQFGIGKFAALTAGKRFEVATQQGDFAASVVFDKKSWESKPGQWTLPIKVHEPDPSRGDGTTITISKLKQTFTKEEDLERVITESVPIRAPPLQGRPERERNTAKGVFRPPDPFHGGDGPRAHPRRDLYPA